MNKHKLIKVILAALFILLVTSWTVFGGNMLGAFILQSESIGYYELSVMFRCKYNPEKNLSLIMGDENIRISLPQNSARFENSIYPEKEGTQFITSIKDIVGYLRLLSEEGWIIEDQMGAVYILRNVNTDKQIQIVVNKFTRYYYRFVYF